MHDKGFELKTEQNWSLKIRNNIFKADILRYILKEKFDKKLICNLI